MIVMDEQSKHYSDEEIERMLDELVRPGAPQEDPRKKEEKAIEEAEREQHIKLIEEYLSKKPRSDNKTGDT